MSKFADIRIDPAIVKRAARGDARAHEIIYRAFAAPVYSICLRFTRIPAQAEDLVQETFIEIMRSIAKFRGEAALGSWIRRIAVSKALMYLRSAWTARGQSLADDWDEVTPGDVASHGVSSRPDVALDLDAALANLPPVSRWPMIGTSIRLVTSRPTACRVSRTWRWIWIWRWQTCHR